MTKKEKFIKELEIRKEVNEAAKRMILLANEYFPHKQASFLCCAQLDNFNQIINLEIERAEKLDWNSASEVAELAAYCTEEQKRNDPGDVIDVMDRIIKDVVPPEGFLDRAVDIMATVMKKYLELEILQSM